MPGAGERSPWRPASEGEGDSPLGKASGRRSQASLLLVLPKRSARLQLPGIESSDPAVECGQQGGAKEKHRHRAATGASGSRSTICILRSRTGCAAAGVCLWNTDGQVRMGHDMSWCLGLGVPKQPNTSGQCIIAFTYPDMFVPIIFRTCDLNTINHDDKGLLTYYPPCIDSFPIKDHKSHVLRAYYSNIAVEMPHL